MRHFRPILIFVWVATFGICVAGAQVYSPKVLAKNQVDAGDLAEMARGIYAKAGAVTPRQKAEAIWRFFLTDGRFVAPGFWYHIAGWAYEEPQGEVLDALKLLNSYGFGLCYAIAPLLQAVYNAGGFEDARVWFLTGHTVTEVYYDGAYHHFDSDMMGYTAVGEGDPRQLPVASVTQIARDGNIVLSRLKSPTETYPSKVDFPWYPADLREAAIGDLASLFTSQNDNWLFASPRYSRAHSMEFVLRPGERLIRYFQPEAEGTFYLPFKFDGKGWTEFPAEIAQYNIRTQDGPRSQRDDRRWATGRIEYTPVLSDKTAYFTGPAAGMNTNLRLPGADRAKEYLGRKQAASTAHAVFEMRSAYVLIDAEVSLDVDLKRPGQSLGASISVDGGRSWEEMANLAGPFHGKWRAQPSVKVRSKHGSLSEVSGKYQYLVRLSMSGPGGPDEIRLRNVRIASRFQLNPRTLPELAPGVNTLSYKAGAAIERRGVPVKIDELSRFAVRTSAVRCVREEGQDILWPDEGATAEIVFELAAPGGSDISGFAAGARFLDLRDGLAPDKLTAETRATRLGQKSTAGGASPGASLEWATSPSGDYRVLWEYDPRLQWRDGIPVDRVLRWPEVDREVRALPAGTQKVYVRYRFHGMGMDSPRLAAIIPKSARSSALEITHQWSADGQNREHLERITNAGQGREYRIDAGSARQIINRAVIFYCPPSRSTR